jgi:hypothetical protein
MANRNKFEEMLERLINEDREGAEELFHEIVVEKSRDIYESLLEDDLADEEVDEAADESDDDDLDEAEDEDDDDELEEDFDLDEFEVEANPMDMGGDPTDDMMGDIEMPPADMDGDMDMDDMDMEGDDDVEDRIEDLEDALEELTRQFNELMADEEGEDDDMDMDMDMDSDEDDDDDDMDMDVDMDDEEEPKESTKTRKSAGEEMREYVEKVTAKMGDNGQNTKSTVAGKNDMGGKANNLNQGGESKSEGTKGGLLAPSTKDMNTKNVNVPGAKGATKMSNQPGHGAEKKGKPETADKGAGSPLNGAPKRAK